MPPPTSTSAAVSGDGDERVLSHGDVVLLRSDLSLLRGPHFLNDRLLAFFFSQLSSSLPFAAAAGDGAGEVLLLPPSIAFLLAHCPDAATLAAVAAPLRLASRRLALLPVNDNPDVSAAEGGSHWSLLVLHSPAASPPRFVHHDSFGGANLAAARRLCNALRPLTNPNARLVEGPMPQQRNGCDCGVYVMAVAKAICDWYGATGGGGGTDWFDAVRREVDETAVREMRGEVLRLILGLMEQNKG